DAYAALDVPDPAAAPLVFVTHSIPTSMEEASGAHAPAPYSVQHLQVAEVVADRVGERTGWRPQWRLAYCSRSGNPATPWLEPDISDALTELHEQGAPGAVVAPIGFISDHMEVIYDLDTEARETADELGLPMERAATVGTHAAFVRGLVSLLLERAAVARGEGARRETVGDLGRWHEVCPAECCLVRHGRPTGVPAACQQAPTPSPA
ncbi:ferrochelatase, partial [Georgenia sp. 10Sc9-8]|nr:ferrochelatase [Georgenia halotolerans]